MNIKKLLIAGTLTLGIMAGGAIASYADNLTYKVQSGDTFWIISQKFGISLTSLMKANNADDKTILRIGQTLTVPLPGQTVYTVRKGDTYWTISQKFGVDFRELLALNNANSNSWLNIGDSVRIPSASSQSGQTTYTVKAGDTFWIISQKFGINHLDLMKANGADDKTILYAGQKLIIPQSSAAAPALGPAPDQSKPYITYSSYTVAKGDNSWTIADKFGIPASELMQVNNLTDTTVLNIGDVLKIPVHHIPIKSTPGGQYGEYLDWWSEAQYVIPIGAVFEVVDFETGKSFMAKRTAGSNHADSEPLTLEDTNKMKEIWGGELSWVRRAAVIKYNGRKIAASVAAMPHAGNDAVAGGAYASWRSGDYPGGFNLDYVKNNGVDGVFDIHFLNSTRHVDGKLDPEHQALVKVAAGIK